LSPLSFEFSCCSRSSTPRPGQARSSFRPQAPMAECELNSATGPGRAATLDQDPGTEAASPCPANGGSDVNAQRLVMWNGNRNIRM
uniref:Uncharacterized protein n=1 Tax=Aegilops tauschii subsp. strangulata TaxID=200361 RepID=A0A452Y5R5_AEGTS